MSVSTPENQGWGTSLLGDSWGSESQLHRGRAVNVGATQKTSSPPGLPGMVACESSEACGWPTRLYLVAWGSRWECHRAGSAFAYVHGFTGHSGVPPGGHQDGGGALPGLGGRTCLERKVDFEQPGTMARILVYLSWPVPSPGGQ